MNNYLCANRHHFRAPEPACPIPGCTAEVRSTTAHPLHDAAPAFEKLSRRRDRVMDELEIDAELHPKDGHSIRWWAYDGTTRIRRNSSMPDSAWNWDATCSCGWDSRTGGAVYSEVERKVQEHKR